MRSTTLRRGRTSSTSLISLERRRESNQVAAGQIPHWHADDGFVVQYVVIHLHEGHEETMMRMSRVLFACAWLAVAGGACADSTVEVFLNSS